MILRIDHLALMLPPGFEARAESIARLIGERLASAHVSTWSGADRMTVPALGIPDSSMSDSSIATEIADGIGRAAAARKEVR